MRTLPLVAALGLCLAFSDARAADDPEPGAEDVQSDALERPTGVEVKKRTLAEIKKSGYLRILTRNNATSFFVYRG